jgi:NADP-dependent 3-hydroxy acid dehydrogenase YdfG
MSRLDGQVVWVTGASSGIGKACAESFADAGARVLIAARRGDRLKAIAKELASLGAPEVHPLTLDVRDGDAVARAIDELPAEWKRIEVLVNSAGLSRGLEPLHEGRLENWEEMIDTNIKGLLYVNRAALPLMVERGRGTIVHIGSIAGRQVYPGGNVYCATKYAVRALTESLRIDLLGTGVRTCSIDPGMVDTEFSAVRFHGDTERAKAVYRGLRPLTAEDVAEVVLFAATRPPHVDLAEVLLLPTDQASANHLLRRG